MIAEMMREAAEGSAASNTGKSTKQRNTAASTASRGSSTQNTSQTQETREPEGPEKIFQTERPGANRRPNSPYSISQQKSDVSAQYREAVAKEQKNWLEQMALEEETNGKDTKKKEEAEEAKRQLEELKKMLERIREQREKAREQQKKNKPKKKTNYNYSRVSTAIGRAKSATQASAALSTASSNLSMIKRMAATGQYDSKDIEVALSHAQKMVRTARKKYVNIKYEVRLKGRNKSKENRKKQQVAQTYRVPRKQKVQRELERLKTLLKNQEGQEKNKNRREEQMELMMADMQYIRRKIDLLKNESNNIDTSAILPGGDIVGDEMMSTVADMESLGMAETAMDAQAGAESSGGASYSGGEIAAAASSGGGGE